MGKHTKRDLQQGSAFERGAESPRAREAADLGAGQATPEAQAPSASQLSRGNAVAYYDQRRKGRGHLARKVLIAVGAVVAVAVVAIVVYVNGINQKLASNVSGDLLSALTDTSNNEPFYTLILGVDKDEERAEGSTYGSSDSSYRSDTIILARIDPQNKKVTLVSIPRDTYVDLGSNGKQKINAAYSLGGAAYAVQVVSQFAGVNISHYVEVDMDGAAAIIDQVGGVTVNLPVPVQDPDYTGLDLPAGEQTLDGTTAALLCRARHAYDAYGGGDFYRAANQRMVIGAVAQKVLSSDPVTMASTVSTMAGYVTTDMDVQTIVSLASKFSGMDIDNDIYSGLCPTTSKYVAGGWYEICDTEAWQAMMKRVDAGETPYTSADQDTTAGVAGSVGVSAGGSDGSSSSDNASSATPVYSGNVLVLNASGKQGAAANVANKLQQKGFDTAADNASGSHEVTMVYYNGDGVAKAAGVADSLGIPTSNVQKNDGSWSTTQDVVVVLGTDWNNVQ